MSDATGSEAPITTTVTVNVDGRDVEAKPGAMLIAAALDNGSYVPHFCWHPRMDPVGMCRQCLVEVEGPRGTQMVVSCMTPVTEGMVCRTDTPSVKRAQEGVLELLLINHPLDCPVCDKGGECPLQDQAFSHGPGESRFVEEKRHYAKPIPISDLVLLDRERCILCDRCTRFAKDVAGDPLIHFTSRGAQTQVLTFPDEPFSSYFSGNTVQICPVGALTARTYRFKARPWDLEQLESTCTTCAVGCRVVVQSSRDQLLRKQGADADAVNWGWLCDKGRFDLESVNAETRLTEPLVRTASGLTAVSWGEALATAASLIQQAVSAGGPSSVAVLGGARGTNQDAYAWAKLAKSVIGTDNVDAQMADGLPAELVLGLPRATIDEAAAASTVLLLGPDLKEELPVLFLRLRDSIARRHTKLVELTPAATGLTSLASVSMRTRPGDLPAAVRALVGNGAAGAVGLDDATVAAARELLGSGSLVIVLGVASLAEASDLTVEAALALRDAFPQATFLTALRRGNVFGALDMGMAPGVLPGRVPLGAAPSALAGAWPSMPAERGLDAVGICQAAAAGRIGCLVLVGADPLSDLPDADLARRALAGAGAVIALDTTMSPSAAQATIVLPAAAWGEKAGTTTNLEGRVSRVVQKVTPKGTSRADWAIAAELATHLGADLGFGTLADIDHEISAVVAPYAEAATAGLRSTTEGVLAVGSSLEPIAPEPRQVPAADAYAMRLVVSRKLYDGGMSTATSGSLAKLAPGASVHVNPHDAERLGVANGVQVKVTSARTSLVVPLVADAGVPRGSAWMPANQPDAAASALVDLSSVVTDVRVETL